MSPNTTRFRPALDACEPRLAPSAGVAAQTLAVVSGAVPAPHAVAGVTFPVSSRNVGGRHSIIVGTSVRPGAGSPLLPAVVGARGPTGARLRVHPGVPFVPGRTAATQAYVRIGQPGALTTGVTGRRATTGAFQLGATLIGDVNGDGQVTVADLPTFVKSFNTIVHDPNYNPAADFDHNGYIGLGDAKLLVRNETPLTPKIPLSVDLILAPQDAAKGPTPKNSGGKTHHEEVTLLGHTTPGAIVISDSGLGDYTFTGPALATDAQGNFSIKVRNREGLNNFNFLAIDPYGQQVIRDFPIFWLDFAAPGSTLK